MDPKRHGLFAAVQRGYNLMTCTILGLAGLAFGTVIFDEADFPDKIDDAVLLLVAVAAVIWYVSGDNRFKRTVVPIILTAIAVLGQLAGVLIEHDDAGAFGDNIGGMIMYTGLLIVLIVQYYASAKYLRESGHDIDVGAAAPGGGVPMGR